MIGDPVAAAAEMGVALGQLGTPERAQFERKYLKSEIGHFGTSVPNIRVVVNAFLRTHPAIDHDQLLAVCRALWSTPIHEHRMAAVELLGARPGLVAATDIALIETMLRESRTWALVDGLAGNVVARLVHDDPSLLGVLDRWVTDDDFWIRRSGVLGLRRLLPGGDELDRFFRYADMLLADREFFIRKALGWVARETGRHHPDQVSAWLRRNQLQMNRVTIREAVKHLPDGDEILAAWKARPAHEAGPARFGPDSRFRRVCETTSGSRAPARTGRRRSPG